MFIQTWTFFNECQASLIWKAYDNIIVVKFSDYKALMSKVDGFSLIIYLIVKFLCMANIKNTFQNKKHMPYIQ